jgi:hypothetical protein
MTEKYLEGTKDKCAPVSDIAKYIKSQRTASESSVRADLIDESKFAHI